MDRQTHLSPGHHPDQHADTVHRNNFSCLQVLQWCDRHNRQLVKKSYFPSQELHNKIGAKTSGDGHSRWYTSESCNCFVCLFFCNTSHFHTTSHNRKQSPWKLQHRCGRAAAIWGGGGRSALVLFEQRKSFLCAACSGLCLKECNLYIL